MRRDLLTGYLSLKPMSSLSLQTHLVSSQPQLPAVSVDPRGFKTALQSLTNFLIEHKVPATLWLKLPKDDAWWNDIWQYGQQAAGCTIYSLGQQTGTPPDNLAASLRPIPIEQDAQLKREYLCLAVADNFVAVLLAARTPPAIQTADKRTLKLYSTLSGHTAAALSTGIKAIIERSLPQGAEHAVTSITSSSETTAHLRSSQAGSHPSEPGIGDTQTTDESMIAASAVLNQWSRCFPNDLATRNCHPLADAYLTWQLQSQEDLRAELVNHRNTEKDQASSTLSTLCPDFLSRAGRELQAPLTTIKTALTLLGSPTLKLAQRQRYLDMISSQCDRQKSLITSVIDLLQLHTTESLPPQALQLANIIPGIVSTYQPIAEERGIMLAYTVPTTLSEIMGTEAELKQIVIHLLNNGIQTTPKGGRVWVSAAPYEDKFVVLSIQDSGAGMSKTETAKLFEAFYRSPTSGKEGTGLDLTLVEQLVKRMGGSVSVESVLNKGTTFKILLPVQRMSSSSSATTAASAPHQTTSHHQALAASRS